MEHDTFKANLQHADAERKCCVSRGKEGCHRLGKPIIQMHAIEPRHCALAAKKITITLYCAD